MLSAVLTSTGPLRLVLLPTLLVLGFDLNETTDGVSSRVDHLDQEVGIVRSPLSFKLIGYGQFLTAPLQYVGLLIAVHHEQSFPTATVDDTG